jgi:HEAT repeat protein
MSFLRNIFGRKSSYETGFTKKEVRAFCRQLKSRDPEIRGSAANNLGAIRDGDIRVVKALIAALGDRDYGVRTMAAMSLGIIGDKSAIEPLLEVINDPNDQVRGFVRSALDKLGARY